ncbi:MAG: hypothetical protein M9909_02065 [Thermomicrobiales bacterium]|nr:hypothetical protein [Thermomicrobiales bacterium]
MNTHHSKIATIRAALLTLIIILLAGCGAGNQDNVRPTQPPTGKETPEEIIKPSPTGDIPTAAPPMASTFDADGDGFMTRDELKEAVRTRESEFVFPNGYVLSVDRIINVNTAQLPSYFTFENGAEYMMIGHPHMCAWAQTFLDAATRGDNMATATALMQLRTVKDNPMYQYVTDMYLDMFARAELGDVAQLQNWVSSECRWDVFESTPISLSMMNPPIYGRQMILPGEVIWHESF